MIVLLKVRNIGSGLVLLGTFLLLVASIGHWTDLGNYKSGSPREWEKFDPLLESELDSFPKLVAVTNASFNDHMRDREKMDILYRTVAERFTHGEAKHTFFSNWLLYIAGKVHPVYSHIWDPNLLVARGHSVFCDQSSYVLLNLALEHGVKARHVSLYGHVVMEAWYSSDWHLYDPDLEVVPLDSTGRVLSVEELARDQELLTKYYAPHQAVNIVGSRENNSYISYPEGARFEWKSNVLVYLEKMMEVLKFAFPVLFLLLGAWLLNRPSAPPG